jgi:hypothetical protein
MSQPYDRAQRRAAARLTQHYPHWLILWGTGTQAYWAYPRFPTPPGTIITAPTITGLLANMRHTELAAHQHAHLPGQPPPRTARQSATRHMTTRLGTLAEDWLRSGDL